MRAEAFPFLRVRNRFIANILIAEDDDKVAEVVRTACELYAPLAEDAGLMLTADVPFVFRRFWRADASRHLPGNGLGLALVKAIATSYGGVVSCVSEEGRGSTFTVFLPVGGREN